MPASSFRGRPTVYMAATDITTIRASTRTRDRLNALARDSGADARGDAALAAPHLHLAAVLLPQPPSVPYVMAQVGHNDPKVTLGIYAQVISSKDDHGAALDDLVGDIGATPSTVSSAV